MQEEWRSVVGYEEFYEVSDLGRVRSLDRIDSMGRLRRGKVLKSREHHNGIGIIYWSVALYARGEQRCSLIHQLVLEAFVGPRPKDHEGAHCDGDPANNKLANLAWKTCKANAADRIRHGTSGKGEANTMAKLSETDVATIKRRLSAGDFQDDIAADFGVRQQAISKIATGTRWTHV